MIFIAIVLILGLVTRQRRRYWGYAGAAVAVHLLTGFLFAGGGTLEDPTGDGLITAWIRQATGDGPVMAILGLAVIAIGWGVPIWLVVRGYQKHRPPVADEGTGATSPEQPES